MFCPKCGSQIPDNASFCAKCGAQVQAVTDQQQTQAGTTAASKRSSRGKLIGAAIAGVAVVAVIAAVAGFVTGLFDGVSDSADTSNPSGFNLGIGDASEYRRAVSAGDYHAVGLHYDGTVIIAGKYSYLGLADDGFSQKPGSQPDVSDWKDIVAVSAGHDHIVGLRQDGTVVATGWNEYGQCDVSGWRDVVAVEAGYGCTIGLLSNGTVVAAGFNDNGECDVSGWSDIISITAGRGCTIGVHADGSVVYAGRNKDMQEDLAQWSNIASVSAGWKSYALGLRSDGTVVAASPWGEYEDVSTWSGIVSVAAGEYPYGLREDGTVVCAGGSDYSVAVDVGEWRNVVAIDAGEDFVMGLRGDGTVVYAGDNSDGAEDVAGFTNIGIPSIKSANPDAGIDDSSGTGKDAANNKPSSSLAQIASEAGRVAATFNPSAGIFLISEKAGNTWAGDSAASTWTYDDAGNCLQFRRVERYKTKDPITRKEVTETSTREFTYSHDQFGYVSSVSGSVLERPDSSSELSLTNVVDPMGRLTSSTLKNPDNGVTVFAEYSYYGSTFDLESVSYSFAFDSLPEHVGGFDSYDLLLHGQFPCLSEVTSKCYRTIYEQGGEGSIVAHFAEDGRLASCNADGAEAIDIEVVSREQRAGTTVTKNDVVYTYDQNGYVANTRDINNGSPTFNFRYREVSTPSVAVAIFSRLYGANIIA